MFKNLSYLSWYKLVANSEALFQWNVGIVAIKELNVLYKSSKKKNLTNLVVWIRIKIWNFLRSVFSNWNFFFFVFSLGSVVITVGKRDVEECWHRAVGCSEVRWLVGWGGSVNIERGGGGCARGGMDGVILSSYLFLHLVVCLLLYVQVQAMKWWLWKCYTKLLFCQTLS